MELSDLELEYIRYLVGNITPREVSISSKISGKLKEEVIFATQSNSGLPYNLYHKLCVEHDSRKGRTKQIWLDQVNGGKTELGYSDWVELVEI